MQRAAAGDAHRRDSIYGIPWHLPISTGFGEHRHGSGGKAEMKTSRRAGIVLPLVSLVTVFALSAQAEPNGPPPKGAAKPAAHAAPGHPAAVHQGTGPGAGHAAGAGPGAGHAGTASGHGAHNAHLAHGN